MWNLIDYLFNQNYSNYSEIVLIKNKKKQKFIDKPIKNSNIQIRKKNKKKLKS